MVSDRFKIIKTEKLPDAEALITGEITLPFLVELRNEALKSLGKEAKLPGFRPGHIPDEVLVKNFGEMRILEETAEIALAQEFGNILKETNLSSLGRPEISITKLAPGIPLEFRIKVYLEPEFELPDYRKLILAVEAELPQEKRRLKIIESLVSKTEISLPKVLVESELERMLAQFRGDVENTLQQGSGQAGLKWADYLQQVKKTEIEIKEEWHDKAVDRVKAELIIAKIAEKEKLEPEKEAIEHEAEHLLHHYPDADPIRVRLYFYTRLQTQKVLEFLENLK